jgi:hypothetical protein
MPLIAKTSCDQHVIQMHITPKVGIPLCVHPQLEVIVMTSDRDRTSVMVVKVDDCNVFSHTPPGTIEGRLVVFSSSLSIGNDSLLVAHKDKTSPRHDSVESGYVGNTISVNENEVEFSRVENFILFRLKPSFWQIGLVLILSHLKFVPIFLMEVVVETHHLVILLSFWVQLVEVFKLLSPSEFLKHSKFILPELW